MLSAFFRSAFPILQSSLPNESFDYKNASHLELIKQKIIYFNQTLTVLKNLDYQLFLGVAIGSSCYFGSYALPLTTLAIASFSFAAYAYAKRPAIYESYRQALNELIEVYQWSMAKNTDNHGQKLTLSIIQQLILTLGPYVAPAVIHTWSLEDVKPYHLSPATLFNPKRPELSVVFTKQLENFAAGNQVSELPYRLYGQHGLQDIWQTLKIMLAIQLKEKLTTPATTLC